MTNLKAELIELIEGFSNEKQARALRILRRMAVPLKRKINPDSELCTPEFVIEFEDRLHAHHGTHTTPLLLTALESAFLAACVAAGMEAHSVSSKTTRFIDVIIDNARVGLKSTAAKSVRENSAHISKLSEASWIQDMRGAQMRMEKTKAYIREYMESVDRVYQLRIIPHTDDWDYQLIEIPLRLFRPILDMDKSLFDSDGPRIRASDDLGHCLTLKLDRSDAKITVTDIPISRCIVHARWRVPKVIV